MTLRLASLLFSIGIAGLFYLDRSKSPKVSGALWIPVIWLWIIGSRPVSVWLNITPSGGAANQELEGSPVDALILLLLIVAGMIALSRHRAQTFALLRASAPVCVYFGYGLLTVLWAPYVDVAFKRWVKDVGDLIIGLVILTEADPVGALHRVFSRVGFILLPVSVLLIKYSDLGHAIDPFGNFFNTGVTTNKNTLGMVVFVFLLGAVWNLQSLFHDKAAVNRRRRLVAQGTLVGFGLLLLAMAHSATSIACFTLGAVLILVTGLPSLRTRPRAVHVLVVTILLAGGLTMLFGGEGSMVHALGRKDDFTGRTEIWRAVIPLAPNPIFGAGFESFWISPGVDKLWNSLSGWARALNTAHNGYIETYLNLGWIGVCLLISLLLSGYFSAIAAFRKSASIGALALAYVATSIIYSVTEAGFRMLTPTWILLLLSIVAAGGVSRGCLRVPTQPRRRRSQSDVAKLEWGDRLPTSENVRLPELQSWTTRKANGSTGLAWRIF